MADREPTFRCSHYERGRADERRKVLAKLTSDRCVEAVVRAQWAEHADHPGFDRVGEYQLAQAALSDVASLLAPEGEGEARNDKVVEGDGEKNKHDKTPAASSSEPAGAGEPFVLSLTRVEGKALLACFDARDYAADFEAAAPAMNRLHALLDPTIAPPSTSEERSAHG